MKVIMIATGEIAEVNESYGARLIEQGKAVMAPPPRRKRRNRSLKPKKRPNRSPRRSAQRNDAECR